MNDQRLYRLADLLVNYSTEVKKDDFVFLYSEDVAVEWMAAVAESAAKAGGHVETHLYSQEVNEALLGNSSIEQLEGRDRLMEYMLANIDVWLTAWGSRNLKAFSGIAPEKIRAQARGARSWRRFYSDRTASGALRWCGTQFPTTADAQEAAMSLREYEDFVYGAGLLDREDPVNEWRNISASQERWVRYLDGKESLHFLAEDTDLTVHVAGRKWINCDGKMNFPDGEVFTTPLKDGVNGHIRYSFPAIYMSREIEDVRLEVRDGRVVEASAAKGTDFLNSVLDTDAGARYFGEVAIGTNFGIDRFTKNMLFDEKIGGTVHLALGDASKETGGDNESAIHWDMLCDMRNGGEIRADGELFYRDGRFIESVL